MDTSNQDQNQQSQGITQPTQQPARPQQTATPASAQSVSSSPTVKPVTATVTPGSKEAAPMGDSAHVSEAALRQLADEESEDAPSMVTAHPVEVERSAELQHAGVSEGSDTQLKISQELQEAGVTQAKEETPINIDDAAAADLPMGYTQAKQTRKQESIRSALKWFAAQVVYQWRRLNPELPK